MAESYDITAASAQDKGNEMDLFTVATAEEGLTNAEIAAQLEKSIEGRALTKVLIIPPDFTRYHSNAGYITCEYYKLLAARGATVDVMPALGLWINREKFTA